MICPPHEIGYWWRADGYQDVSQFFWVLHHLAPLNHGLVWFLSGEEYLFVFLTLFDPCVTGTLTTWGGKPVIGTASVGRSVLQVTDAQENILKSSYTVWAVSVGVGDPFWVSSGSDFSSWISDADSCSGSGCGSGCGLAMGSSKCCYRLLLMVWSQKVLES